MRGDRGVAPAARDADSGSGVKGVGTEQRPQPSLNESDVLKMVLETSYDGIAICDATGVITHVNSSYERITGIPRAQIIGRRGRDLVKENILSEYLADRIIETRQPVMTIQRYRTGRSAVIVGNPMLDEQGRVAMIVFNVRDVTELHTLRSQLSVTKEESERYRSEVSRLRVASACGDGLIAQSPRMQEVLEVVRALADVDTTVLLLGESGVGKGVMARTIHQLSRRADGPLITVNCAALPEALLEAELFGYVPGAFTGADSQGKPGLFEVADGGTLFLDEVAEMAPSLQAKLLHVVQEREVRRVGATRARKVDVRLIAATNRDLEQYVREGRFREDLYYRLSVVPITIPPLRERPQDVLALLHHFLQRFGERHNRPRHFTNEAITLLLEYSWPGNVRELENLVERLVVTSPGPYIRAEDLPASFQGGRDGPKVKVLGLMPLDELKEEAERQLFRLAARQLRSTRQVAKVLKVSQATAARRMKRFLRDSTGNEW